MAKAYAQTNIALIKYWGKRPGHLNLPATGSLSMTLDGFGTETEVCFQQKKEDSLILNGQQASEKERLRVTKYLNIFRELSGKESFCQIISRNDVPTAAGLASSASAFAALAAAAAKEFSLSLSNKELSILARRGSGSAARSIFSGYVKMNAGKREDGHDSFAQTLKVHESLDLQLLVVQCANGAKKISSSKGMIHTEETSPFYQAWVSSHQQDLDTAEKALLDGDFLKLGQAMEHSTLKMHASAFAAKPGLWYWNPSTLLVMNLVRELREEEGLSVFFTMDAGPHVKILCQKQDSQYITNIIHALPEVHSCQLMSPGKGIKVY